MDNFRDYIYYLLWSPLKKIEKGKNAWYKLAKVYGSLFDKAKAAILKAREETMVATCSSAMLQVHADERRLTRYTDETDENYRRRIATYPEVCRLGGTDQGVKLAVKALGYDRVEIKTIKEFYGDSDRWAEFLVNINMEFTETFPIGFDILRKAVRQTKEVGAKDNYLFTFHVSHVVIMRYESSVYFHMQFYPQLNLAPHELEGAHELDGSKPLNGYSTDQLIDLYPVQVTIHNNIRQQVAEIAKLRLHSKISYMEASKTSISQLIEAPLQVSQETEVYLQNKCEAASTGSTQVTVEDHLRYLDDNGYLDGNGYLNADIYHYEI